jgi:class 3 adenylate cyclase
MKRCGGNIRSFDGDRVMGVFGGSDYVDDAAKAALGLKAARDEVILPALRSQWKVDTSPWKFNYGSGLDTSMITVIRAGVRGDNDLVWIGSCANHAAKLSAMRDQGFNSYASPRFINKLTLYRSNSDHTPTWQQPHGTSYFRSASSITLGYM